MLRNELNSHNTDRYSSTSLVDFFRHNKCYAILSDAMPSYSPSHSILQVKKTTHYLHICMKNRYTDAQIEYTNNKETLNKIWQHVLLYRQVDETGLPFYYIYIQTRAHLCYIDTMHKNNSHNIKITKSNGELRYTIKDGKHRPAILQFRHVILYTCIQYGILQLYNPYYLKKNTSSQ